MANSFTAGKFRAVSDIGLALVGGRLYTYASGTLTPKATYNDPALVAPNTNPVVLDARGEANVWLAPGLYRFRLENAFGVLIWDVDGFDGTPGVSSASLAAPAGASLVGFQALGTGSLATSLQARIQETLSASDFGALAGGNAAPALILALTAASSRGIPLYIPPGTYQIDTDVSWPVSNGCRVICSPSARFVVGATYPATTAVFRPTNGGGDSSEFEFAWTGGVIDGRAQPTPAGGSADLMSVASKVFKKVNISHVQFLNNDDRDGLAGDSGLFLAEGEDYEVHHCYFRGAVDSGLYISGSNDLTRGKRISVVGNTFVECANGLISKRQFQDHAITGNLAEDCNFGMVVGGEADTVLKGGRDATITGNVFRRCRTGVAVRLADGTVVVGNRFIDCNRDKTGVGVASGNIRIQGSRNCVVIGNTFSSPGLTQVTSGCAVQLGNFVFNAVTTLAERNIVEGNNIADMNIGVHELAAQAANNLIGATNFYSTTAMPFQRSSDKTVVGGVANGSAPAYQLNDPGESANERMWRLIVASKSLTIGTVSDDGATSNIGIRFSRGTGTAIDRVVFNAGSFPNYADDTAAAGGGVIVGQAYRTGSAVKIRIT